MLTKVLIIEDDCDFSAELSSYLGRNGIVCTSFQCLSAFEAFLERGDGDGDELLLLDLGLSDGDGLEYLSRSLNGASLPCIVLTGNDNARDRVLALELGADDYIVKTAPPREILARIHAVMRRTAKQTGQQASEIAPPSWLLSRARRDLLNPEGCAAGLTGAEYEILSSLAAASGEPVDRHDLSRIVLRREYDQADRSLDNLVSRIRRKVVALGGREDIIRSVRQYGYVFTGFHAASEHRLSSSEILSGVA